ncbi:MAG: hypothetical protein KF799_13560 [Bdellovibrionales bacterium]|nr:hypothetical protein [Bdellovibrionales bacterium]
MKRLFVLAVLLGALTGCRTTPEMVPDPKIQTPMADPHEGLKTALGMYRSPGDLGFAEKSFNPCSFGLSGGQCKNQYFSVVHFQLLCRDSEGSVSSAPIALQPIVAGNVKWKVGNQSGGTQTDSQGFGQFTMMSPRSARGQRLTLRIGPQFVAFTVSEVSKIILPKNFCRS